MSKRILITGGAGYIGSHAVDLLAQKGYEVIIFDNFSRGFKQAVSSLAKQYPEQVTLQKGDLRNITDVKKLFNTHKIDSVMHFAALCSVNESTENPALYYQNNVMGSINLLSEMLNNKVKNIIFSSTCASYGDSQYLPIDEKHPQYPVNAYGTSKFTVEQILQDYNESYGLNYISFRYFNVCGAHPDGLVGDSKKPSVHLMQNAVRGALGIEEFSFTCPRVQTPDGTTIRDYVDVNDLVKGHLLGLQYLTKEKQSGIFNLGTGKGYSTKEIVDMVEKVTGSRIKRKKGKTRKGESPKIVASYTKAKKILGWKPETSLQQSVKSLITWYNTRPNGWDY